MQRVTYIFKVIVAHIISASIFYWLFCPYNIVGAEQYLPKRSFLKSTLAILFLFAIGVWLRVSKLPAVPEFPPFSKRTFGFLYSGSWLIAFVALLRFSTPLIWSGLPLFGAKLTISESLFWSGLLIIAASAMTVLPICSQSVHSSADEVLATDSRKPILYFRSFEKELAKASVLGILIRHALTLSSIRGAYIFSGLPSQGKRMIRKRAYGSKRSVTDEQMIFADAIAVIGPYVALGRLTENFRDMDIGAAKEYVSNDKWQETVVEWIRRCAAVVVEAADSKSLGWELERIIEMVPPHRILLICPHSDKEYSASGITKEPSSSWVYLS